MIAIVIIIIITIINQHSIPGTKKKMTMLQDIRGTTIRVHRKHGTLNCGIGRSSQIYREISKYFHVNNQETISKHQRQKPIDEVSANGIIIYAIYYCFADTKTIKKTEDRDVRSWTRSKENVSPYLTKRRRTIWLFMKMTYNVGPSLLTSLSLNHFHQRNFLSIDLLSTHGKRRTGLFQGWLRSLFLFVFSKMRKRWRKMPLTLY